MGKNPLTFSADFVQKVNWTPTLILASKFLILLAGVFLIHL